jgi:ribosomal protein S18 acetylase RimI-like enzyme
MASAVPVPGADLTVRRATTGDVGALATVAAATFRLACPPSVTEESMALFVQEVLSAERFEEYLADPARMLFVAERPGVPGALGYAMLVVGEPADEDVRAAISHRPTAELSKIYVLPDAHGGGAGRLLMAAALDAARAAGVRGVWLGVNQLNARAQRFYAKSGFTRVGTKRFLVGHRYEDDYVYEQRLRTR